MEQRCYRPDGRRHAQPDLCSNAIYVFAQSEKTESIGDLERAGNVAINGFVEMKVVAKHGRKHAEQ
jgi:hypothetical protein